MTKAMMDDPRRIREENPFESMMERFDRAAQLLNQSSQIGRNSLHFGVFRIRLLVEKNCDRVGVGGDFVCDIDRNIGAGWNHDSC